MSDSFEYIFPAIRGVQAQREYYISMCPLRLIPKIFTFNEEELLPELRAQRVLNKSRLPEIAQYILNNRDSYTFSAITASVDADLHFEPMSEQATSKRLGVLRIPMSARFVINDGQHRRAAIEMALRENPELGDETIAVVLFVDVGLERCQQMFADLNRYAIRPSKSIGVLYDHRDDIAQLAKTVVFKSPVFRDVVDLEHSTLSLKSRKLFTLSAIYSATSALLSNIENRSLEEQVKLAADFWEETARQFPEWQLVRERKLAASEVRKDFIHSHGTALQAIGRTGNVLLRNGTTWKRQLDKLKTLDWSRSNAKLWEGRAIVGGRVSKATQNVVLTTNLLKQHIGLPLSTEEQSLENAFQRGDHGTEQ
jgi:DNA sulfur modification protein DndB